jgi:formylglycine-generating enzyme required for sulfatase activity
MVWIEPSDFLMGSPEDEPQRSEHETQHRVTLTKGFWLGKYPVTQREWQELMEHDPSNFVTGKMLKKWGWFTASVVMPDSASCPVEQVSWINCWAYGERLTEIERAAKRLPDGLAYALPTEAQWEYACRAGSIRPYAGTGNLDKMGWYDGNSSGRTHPVGEKEPNAWGLYDMHGNVWEWCADWSGAYDSDMTVDPIGPASGTHYILRGGGWVGIARDCRSARRLNGMPLYRSPFIGFRLALSAIR